MSVQPKRRTDLQARFACNCTKLEPMELEKTVPGTAREALRRGAIAQFDRSRKDPIKSARELGSIAWAVGARA